MNQSDIKVSIYGSCNRPHLWEWFYSSVEMNSLNFEIVFVGNVKPTFTLPDNFKFIYSNVKPAQCNYIGAMNCSGEVIQHIADDCHLAPYGLDMLYSLYKDQSNYKYIVAPKLIGIVNAIPDDDDGIAYIQKYADTQPVDSPDMHIIHGDMNSIPAHIGGFMSRQFYNELGGIDKNFIMQRWDLDLQIRAHQAGAKTIFSDKVWIAERKDLCPNWQSGVTGRYHCDHELYMRMWFSNSSTIPQRSAEFQPYEMNDTILTRSQGPKGEWD